MNIQLCDMTAAAFDALVAASNLALIEPGVAKLGGGFVLACDGAYLYLRNSGVITA